MYVFIYTHSVLYLNYINDKRRTNTSISNNGNPSKYVEIRRSVHVFIYEEWNSRVDLYNSALDIEKFSTFSRYISSKTHRVIRWVRIDKISISISIDITIFQ